MKNKTKYTVLKNICKLHTKAGKLEIELLEACQSGDLQLVKKLHRLGANIFFEHDMSLCVASEFGFLDIVRYLVENGAGINPCPHRTENYYNPEGYAKWAIKFYPLYNACHRGHWEVVKYLIDCGARIDIHHRIYPEYEMYDWLLSSAVHGGNYKIVKLLITKGVEMEMGDEKILRIAMSKLIGSTDRDTNEFRERIKTHSGLNQSEDLSSRVKIIKYLFRKGAQTDFGHSDDALKMCVQIDNLKLFKFFISKGMDINSITFKEYGRNGSINIVKYLVENDIGIDPQKILKGVLGRNAIHYCEGSMELLTYLVENFRDSIDLSEALKPDFVIPIHTFDDQKIIIEALEYLIVNGLDIHYGGDKLLLTAIKNRSKIVTRFLLDKGADINVLTKSQQAKMEKMISD